MLISISPAVASDLSSNPVLIVVKTNTNIVTRPVPEDRIDVSERRIDPVSLRVRRLATGIERHQEHK